MLELVTIAGRTFILGDKKTIGLTNIRSATNVSLAGLTGTVSIYNSAGSASVSGASLTVTFTQTNTRAQATYVLVTGGGGTITVAGTYRAVYKLVFADGSVYEFQQQITVNANPF